MSCVSILFIATSPLDDRQWEIVSAFEGTM